MAKIICLPFTLVLLTLWTGLRKYKDCTQTRYKYKPMTVYFEVEKRILNVISKKGLVKNVEICYAGYANGRLVSF